MSEIDSILFFQVFFRSVEVFYFILIDSSIQVATSGGGGDISEKDVVLLDITGSVYI